MIYGTVTNKIDILIFSVYFLQTYFENILTYAEKCSACNISFWQIMKFIWYSSVKGADQLKSLLIWKKYNIIMTHLVYKQNLTNFAIPCDVHMYMYFVWNIFRLF